MCHGGVAHFCWRGDLCWGEGKYSPHRETVESIAVVRRVDASPIEMEVVRARGIRINSS